MRYPSIKNGPDHLGFCAEQVSDPLVQIKDASFNYPKNIAKVSHGLQLHSL